MQIEIRAIVSPVPYAEVARSEYGHDSGCRAVYDCAQFEVLSSVCHCSGAVSMTAPYSTQLNMKLTLDLDRPCLREYPNDCRESESDHRTQCLAKFSGSPIRALREIIARRSVICTSLRVK